MLIYIHVLARKEKDFCITQYRQHVKRKNQLLFLSFSVPELFYKDITFMEQVLRAKYTVILFHWKVAVVWFQSSTAWVFSWCLAVSRVLLLYYSSGKSSHLTVTLAEFTALYLAWTNIPLFNVCFLFRQPLSDLAAAACFSLLTGEDSLRLFKNIIIIIIYCFWLSNKSFLLYSQSCWTSEKTKEADSPLYWS